MNTHTHTKIDLNKSRFGEKGTAKAFMSKLSKGLMLPIALLPIAGLFLGGGAGIENIYAQFGMTMKANPGAYVFTQVLKQTGDIIFGSLPVLFAVAIAIAFTDDAGVAGFSALIAWLVFNMTQSIFISPNYVDPDATTLVIESYNILFWQAVPTSVVGTNVGIESMVTSVFGGITMGLLVAGIYNKFHTVKLPAVIGFFGGSRSVPIVSFFAAIWMAFIFLFIWPWFGIKLDQFGSYLATMPAELDAFVFGVVERALIPFGLHHAFYTPLWYTSVGGSMYVAQAGVVIDTAYGNQGIWFQMVLFGQGFDNLSSSNVETVTGVTGVANGDYYVWSDTLTSDVVYNDAGDTVTGDVTFYVTEGVQPGSYMQGKYPFMIFGLPAAAAAMIMAADKENRQVASSVIIAAAFTSFLTGITEPIEFTFLFVAPFLYYGFHVWMAGFSFWFLALLGSNIGMTFSGGIIDLALYGILMDATGYVTKSYWAVVVGVGMIPIYYFFFYWYIKKFNVPTPGREGAEVKLMSKADYNAAKSGSSSKGGDRTARVAELAKNLGGLENIESIDACITRLRLVVKDRSKLNDAALMKMGAAGVVGSHKSVQIIFGGEADIFKSELRKLKSK